MNDDLISRSKLIEDITIVINEWIKDMVDGEYLKGCVNFSVVVREMVRKQRTAYDVDKVLEQLSCCEGSCNGRNAYKDCEEGCAGCINCKISDAYRIAIDIVRAGGIDVESQTKK